jgi:uncharacterized membrane protein (UPF0127 family)
MADGLRALMAAGVLAGGVVFALPMCGCNEQGGQPPAPKAPTPSQPGPGQPAQPAAPVNPKMNPALPTEDVTISGRKFKLELATDPDKRMFGLSFRETIAADGGMLFVFPRPVTTSFVMRDCPVPIDIIYLDATGRIVAMHKMVPDPRKPGESDSDYEARLTKYPSGYDTQFVIELKGNTLDSLNLKKNDKIRLDIPKLKKMAK